MKLCPGHFRSSVTQLMQSWNLSDEVYSLLVARTALLVAHDPSTSGMSTWASSSSMTVVEMEPNYWSAKVCHLAIWMHKLPSLTRLLWIVSSLFKSNQCRQHWHRFHTNRLGQPGLLERKERVSIRRQENFLESRATYQGIWRLLSITVLWVLMFLEVITCISKISSCKNLA